MSDGSEGRSLNYSLVAENAQSFAVVESDIGKPYSATANVENLDKELKAIKPNVDSLALARESKLKNNLNKTMIEYGC